MNACGLFVASELLFTLYVCFGYLLVACLFARVVWASFGDWWFSGDWFALLWVCCVLVCDRYVCFVLGCLVCLLSFDCCCLGFDSGLLLGFGLVFAGIVVWR